MLAPTKTPASIRAALEHEVLQIVRSSDVQRRLRDLELDPIGTTGAEAASWLKTATARWKSVIQAARIQLD
jgi:tripartite-type tricarboxylate transporter receptor subunit TctC